MPSTTRKKPAAAAPQTGAKPRQRKTKFQADLAPTEDQMVRRLKIDLELSSNSDFLADAVALMRWAVSERKRGHRIVSESGTGERKVLLFPRLERVAPEMTLPQAEIKWTEQELGRMAELVTGQPAAPTDLLIHAMRH
jgi:hypothetical protein